MVESRGLDITLPMDMAWVGTGNLADIVDGAGRLFLAIHIAVLSLQH